VVGVSADSMDIARGIGERDDEAFSDRPKPASVTIQASICSSLYLILQGVHFWRWPFAADGGQAATIFSLAMGMAPKECLRRRLAEAPVALMRPFLIVTSDPFVEIVLQLRDQGVWLLAESDAVEFILTWSCAGAQRFRSSAGSSSRSWIDRYLPPRGHQ
jgi:hypothetical protein